jgi:cyanate permease
VSGAAIDPALAVGINAVTALVGRIMLGLVIDRFEPRRASAVCFLVQAGAIAVLEYVETPLAVYGACAAYGLAVGNIITLSPMIVQREFTPDRFPAIVALSTAVMQTLYAFGPGLLGVLRDVSGSYGVPLAVCMGLNLMASALILMRSRRPA